MRRRGAPLVALVAFLALHAPVRASTASVPSESLELVVAYGRVHPKGA